MPFFPEFPPALNQALVLGALLAIGALGGALAQAARLPAVFGYIVAGMAVGPMALDLPLKPLLEEARIVVDIAVGLILFELGRRLDLQWLRRDRSLWVASVAECALTFLAIAAALIAFGFQPIHSAMAAAIGVSTSPAIVWLVASDERAQGQVTDRCMSLVALNTLIAFMLTTMLVATVHLEYRAGWFTVIVHPLYLLLGSLALGIATGVGVTRLADALGQRTDAHFGIIVAAVLIAVGFATALKLSVFLALIAAGASARNVERRSSLLEVDLGGGARVLYILLFVVSGASSSPALLGAAGGAAAVYVLARIAGKWLGVMLSAPLAPLPWRQSAYLGLTLMPMSSMALLLMYDIGSRYPQFGEQLTSVLLAAIILFDLAGPLLVRWALVRSGDIHRRPGVLRA